MQVRRRAEPPTVTYWQYVALVRKWDRNALIEGAGWASASNAGKVIVDGEASTLLPWNVAGMAVTAICRGTRFGIKPTEEDVVRLCWMFGNIFDGIADDETDPTRMLSRLFHEQLPYQHDLLHEWSRAQALLVDTDFPAHYSPEIMTDGWIEVLLDGVTVPEYSGTGFVLWASAQSTNGLYNPDVWDDSMDGLLAVLSKERIQEIGLKHFVTDIDGIKAIRKAVPSKSLVTEQFAFNPLQTRPFLSDMLPGTWLAPSTDLLAQKLGVQGIVYSGIDRWGGAFTRDLGHLFQAYIGDHLRLIGGARVFEEAKYGPKKNRLDSCDWFVVLDGLVVYIEVKASSPTMEIRESVENAFRGVAAKLTKAVVQVNESFAGVQRGEDDLSMIPADLPAVALVVTLDSYPSAELAFAMGALGETALPVAFLSAGDLESLVAHDSAEVEALLFAGMKAARGNGIIEYQTVRTAMTRNINPIVDRAWSANPVLRYINDKQAQLTAATPKRSL